MAIRQTGLPPQNTIDIIDIPIIIMKPILFCLLLLFPVMCMAQNPAADGLTCEYLTNPVGIDIVNPRLSWKVSSAQRNTLQLAYHIRVATDASFSAAKTVWNTGKVNADSSILIT